MINPELIHATLEAIRYKDPRTVRGICAARVSEVAEETEQKKLRKKENKYDGIKEWGRERESIKCIVS